MPSPAAFLPVSAWAPGRGAAVPPPPQSKLGTCRQRTVAVMVAQEDLSDGMAVRVCVPTLMHHLPKHGGKPVDLIGKTGTVKKIYTSDLSANRPVVVQFTDPKFSGHFDAAELEVVAE